MKTIINENQMGLLFKNGQYRNVLAPGSHRAYGGKRVEILELRQPLASAFCELGTLLKDQTIAAKTTVVEVADERLALHFVNGKFAEALGPGQYAFWSICDNHAFTMVDISSPEVSPDIPAYIFARLPACFYTKVEVAAHQKARLYYNRRFVRLLGAGTYYFWKTGARVEAELVDTRLTQMAIAGQEILTQDKVPVRINFVCSYRITDCVKISTEINNFEEQIHVAAQLALREYVGKQRLDEILDGREQMSQYVFEKLKGKEQAWYVAFADAGVKDMILPGEVRDIMRTVLVAEKRAQANVISRREEVASTRSLLNTARLMDENQTLYKLKELEYIERICDNVNSINVGANGDLLTQLTSILQGHAPQQRRNNL